MKSDKERRKRIEGVIKRLGIVDRKEGNILRIGSLNKGARIRPYVFLKTTERGISREESKEMIEEIVSRYSNAWRGRLEGGGEYYICIREGSEIGRLREEEEVEGILVFEYRNGRGEVEVLNEEIREEMRGAGARFEWRGGRFSFLSNK